MRWMDDISDSMDMSLSKLQEMEEDREACMLQSLGLQLSDMTERLNNNNNNKVVGTQLEHFLL